MCDERRVLTAKYRGEKNYDFEKGETYKIHISIRRIVRGENPWVCVSAANVPGARQYPYHSKVMMLCEWHFLNTEDMEYFETYEKEEDF